MIRIPGLLLGVLLAHTSFSQQTESKVRIVGAMKDVMWKGELNGKISLDTISPRENLYGMGPGENLAGEILILDGRSYYSFVSSDSLKVEERFDLKAPFFGYAHISGWREQTLPDSVQTPKQLEGYLLQVFGKAAKPFMFKMSGKVEKARLHVVNLPKGSKVSSPEEAHVGQVNFEVEDEWVDIVGFFSTQHKAIFTHHDSFLHMHLITKDRKWMGHVDGLRLKRGEMKIYFEE